MWKKREKQKNREGEMMKRDKERPREIRVR